MDELEIEYDGICYDVHYEYEVQHDAVWNKPFNQIELDKVILTLKMPMYSKGDYWEVDILPNMPDAIQEYFKEAIGERLGDI